MPHIHQLNDFVVSAYIVHEARVLLVHHKGLNLWLPIGGHIELDEDPEQALWREIEEETGLLREELELLSNVRLPLQDNGFRSLPAPQYLDTHVINAGHQHIGLTYFLRAKSDAVRLNADEHYELRWFSKDEIETFPLKENVRAYTKEALRRMST